MHLRRTAIGVAALTGLAATLSGGGTALAASGSGSSARVGVYVSGLAAPFGLDTLGKRNFIVAEAFGGKVTLIGQRGGKRTLVSNAPGVAGVAARDGRVYSVLGGPDGSPRPPGAYQPSRVLRTNPHTGRTTVIANLLAYELRHNPDGQVQVYGPPADRDALSNPFAMTSYPRGLLVADGGANDVLKVNPRTGRVSTFFVPKNPHVAGCQNANPGTTGCDPVPTGVTYAKGSVWVSTLGAEVPGAGRIYKLNPRNGHVRRMWTGLDSPTGIAIGGDGSIYYSQVGAGAPETETPPPGFDPSKVGQITRILHGKVTTAKVTQPTGLVIRDGRLFSTAWSTPFLYGVQHPGQVVLVHKYDFH
jgi:hypothetical protein